MTTNLKAPQAPVTDEELDQMIWKLERDGGMTPKMLSLMKELREVRKAKGEPVAYADPRALSNFKARSATREWMWARSDTGLIPLYIVTQTPEIPDEMAISDDMNLYQKSFAQGHNACRAAMLNAEKLNQPVSETNKRDVIGWVRGDYNSDDKRDPNAPLFMLGINDPSEAWGVKYIQLTSNSPATPDSWKEEAEKLAEAYGAAFVIFRHGEEPVCADPTKFWFGFDPAEPKEENRG